MKDCPIGSSINPSTSRCRKDCKDTHERNVKGKCVSSSNPGMGMDLKKHLAKIKRDEKKQLAIIKKEEKKEAALLKKELAKIKRDEKRAQKKVESDRKKEVTRQRKELARLARLSKQENRIPHPIPFEPVITQTIVSPTVNRVHFDTVIVGCQISLPEVKTLSSLLGVKYTNMTDTCRFISNSLNLPSGTTVTKFISAGTSGVVIGAETPSGESCIAKVMRIEDVPQPTFKRIKGIFPKIVNWASTRTSQMDDEVKNHTSLVRIHKNTNIFGDITGVTIPGIKSSHTVDLPGGKFGVIIMDRINGSSTLKDVIHDKSIPFERKRDIFLKFSKSIARLYGKGVSHGDPHVENVIMIDGTYDDIALIDFASTYFFTFRFQNSNLGQYGHGTVCHPDKTHRISAYINSPPDIVKYDIYQVMTPFYFGTINQDFTSKMGGLDVLKTVRDMFSSSRSILAQRKESGVLSLYDQPGIDRPTSDVLSIRGGDEAFNLRGLNTAITGNHYDFMDHSIVADELRSLKHVIFYPYDLEPLRSFLLPTDTDVSNHLTHDIPELNIKAANVPGETIRVDWSIYL